MSRLMITILAMILVSSCATRQHDVASDEYVLPSYVLKQKKLMDGDVVEVGGYVVSEFEDRGIWDNEHQYKKYRSAESCVSLLIPKNLLDEILKQSRTYAIVTGVFVADLQSRGTVLLGACNAAGIEVQKIEPM